MVESKLVEQIILHVSIILTIYLATFTVLFVNLQVVTVLDEAPTVRSGLGATNSIYYYNTCTYITANIVEYKLNILVNLLNVDGRSRIHLVY